MSADILAPYVRTLGRGPGRSRSLTQAEARAAMAAILQGEAAPEAVGAVFMLMRYRGEIAEEVAGFVEAMRARLSPWSDVGAALDWPCYAAGRSRGLPWFVLAAALVAETGVPVLMHGWTTRAEATPEQAAARLGLPVVETPQEALNALKTKRFAFAPLRALDARLLDLLRLRDILGLRSPVNTCLRALNPAAAPASVQGVFHPSYRELQRDAAALLRQPSLLCLKGGGGEFERHPSKAIALFGLRDGVPFDAEAPPLIDDKRRLSEGGAGDDLDHLAAVWRGAAQDPFAETIIVGTAALALIASGRAQSVAEADRMATRLWADRSAAA